MRLIYLASPYSHVESAVREARYAEVCHLAGHCLRRGVNVYSPIAHSHGIAVRSDLEFDWKAWQKIDEDMILRCDELWVATSIPSWRESVGVAAEIEFALSHEIPVRFVDQFGAQITV